MLTKLHHYGFLTNDIMKSSEDHQLLCYKEVGISTIINIILSNNKNNKTIRTF